MLDTDGRSDVVARWTVKYVVDGDTLWVYEKDPNHVRKVRLLDIDAPERCQPWGVESKAALTKKLRGKKVHLEEDGVDQYKRVLATVYLVDAQRGTTENVNAWLVEQGHAWAGRWRGDVLDYWTEEVEARDDRRGLWAAELEPLSPRAFRREFGPCP